MSTQKFPIVGGIPTGKSSDQHDGHGDADGGRDELLYGERAHLREIRHSRLAAVVLPVRVGHERGSGIEAECLGHGAEVLWVERK